MAWDFASRRAAEEFDRRLGDDRAPGAGEELVALVSALRAVTTPDPSPAFAATLRERLLAEAEAVLVPGEGGEGASAGVREPGRTVRTAPAGERRLAAAIGSLALLGAAASVGVIAQTTVPGDLLYPIKRGIEDGRAVLAVGERAESERLLADAGERLEETEVLAGRTDAEPSSTQATLRDFDSAAGQGAEGLLDLYDRSEPEPVAQVKMFAVTSLDTLGALAPRIPVEADPELENAVRTLVALDARAEDLCAECGGPGIVEIPASLTVRLPGLGAIGPGLPGSVSPGPVPPGPVPPGTVPPGSWPTLGPALPTTSPTTSPSRRTTGSPTRPTTGTSTNPPPSGSPTRLPTRSTAPTTRPSPTGPTSTGTTVAPTTPQPTRTTTTSKPTLIPTRLPTLIPTRLPTLLPTLTVPTLLPTLLPTLTVPTQLPTLLPTLTLPTLLPTLLPPLLTSGGLPTLLPLVEPISGRASGDDATTNRAYQPPP